MLVRLVLNIYCSLTFKQFINTYAADELHFSRLYGVYIDLKEYG